jgi:hypothetical protein
MTRRRILARPRKTRKGGDPTTQDVAQPTSDRSLIRELFVLRQPHYLLADALRLTRTTRADLDAAAASGIVRPETFATESVLPWDDVAALAQERWTPRMIDGALDIDRIGVIPPLNRVYHVDAFLPLYQIRLLHYLAETQRGGIRARLNASDILERQLLDLANTLDAAEVDAAIPGFSTALHYPAFIPRDDDWATAFCRYCGRLSGVPGREMCADCLERHEPKSHLGKHGIPELDVEE